MNACASLLKAGAQCISSARWDLYGGCRVTGIPTVNSSRFISLTCSISNRLFLNNKVKILPKYPDPAIPRLESTLQWGITHKRLLVKESTIPFTEKVIFGVKIFVNYHFSLCTRSFL